MSRSVKKYPGGGFTGASSEKDDKRIWHRRFRRIVRQAIHHEREVMPHFRDVSNPWSMNKDGKQYWVKPRFEDYTCPYKYTSGLLTLLGWRKYTYDAQAEWQKALKDWKQWMRK